MIGDIFGSIFGKDIITSSIGKAIGTAFSGDSGSSKKSVPIPSFNRAYMTDSSYESSPGQAEDIDSTDPNVVLLSWQRRLFSGPNSYSKITLPSITTRV